MGSGYKLMMYHILILILAFSQIYAIRSSVSIIPIAQTSHSYCTSIIDIIEHISLTPLGPGIVLEFGNALKS
ncbi:hypothetical protein BKA69DRAFT_1098694 [Paraphysoderma sedebokerense]|nr:hypothetical protein BKA69DRAFT_1098694 [Paraphysoderma sedebokerense]